MSTNLYAELINLDARWLELETLSAITHQYYNSEESGEYRALCRSTTALICSHLEGALKSVSRAVIRDLNDYACFKDAPQSLQRRYVSDVLLASGDNVNQKAVSRLVDALRDTDFKMDENALFEKNRNPSLNIVDRHFKLFKGEKASLFSVLAGSRIAAVFEGDQAKTKRLLINVRKSCLQGAEQYPYSMSRHYFECDGAVSGASSLFGPFLEDLLQKRHDIVHGNTLSNDLGITAIDDYIAKAKLLTYGYVLAIC